LADVRGKAALVTGGARRVGRAVALELARAGMDVAITYREAKADAQSLGVEVRAMGRRFEAIYADFARDDAVEEVARGFERALGSCYALVNNASCFDPTPFAGLSRSEFDRQMAVNGRAPVFLMQRLAGALGSHASPGRIVNFIDIHVMGEPLAGHLAYNASKAVLREATMTLAVELAPRVTVNAVAPGVVAWAESYGPAEREAYLRRVPLGRAGTPADAAAAVRYLVCDADYCTGQVIRLDGGRLLT
jgi:pteridine reductase